MPRSKQPRLPRTSSVRPKDSDEWVPMDTLHWVMTSPFPRPPSPSPLHQKMQHRKLPSPPPTEVNDVTDHIYEEIQEPEPVYLQPRALAHNNPLYVNDPQIPVACPSSASSTRSPANMTRWSARSNLHYRWGCCTSCDIGTLRQHVIMLLSVFTIFACLAIVVACLTIPPGWIRAITITIMVTVIFLLMFPFCPTPFRNWCCSCFDRIADAI